jgi:mono/diheme cytochrome c family protein
MTRLWKKAFAVVAIGGALVVPALVSAKEPIPPAKQAYLRYCSACHGESGKGDGVVSHLMNPRPADLTQLAKKNNGEFPFMRVIRIIDGRETLRAHGDPDMPVWGEIFAAEVPGAMNKEAQIRGKVLLITEYLASIQQK